MDEVGYDAEWDCLNSKDFGVPQNRERVFIVGHLRGASTRKVFPFGESGKETNEGRVITGTLTARYPAKQREGTYIETSRESHVRSIGNVNPSGNGINGNIFDSSGLSPTLTTNKGEGLKVAIPVLTPDRIEKRQNGRRFKENGEPMFTLTGQDRHGVLIQRGFNGKYKISENETGALQAARVDKVPLYAKECQIRKLTPRECWRLQGFPDWAFDRAQKVNSDSQLYKQAGNSVTVNVIYEIARRL
jgi:DNA (cytosine-5)-methyltransferase 1